MSQIYFSSNQCSLSVARAPSATLSTPRATPLPPGDVVRIYVPAAPASPKLSPRHQKPSPQKQPKSSGIVTSSQGLQLPLEEMSSNNTNTIRIRVNSDPRTPKRESVDYEDSNTTPVVENYQKFPMENGGSFMKSWPYSSTGVDVFNGSREYIGKSLNIDDDEDEDISENDFRNYERSPVEKDSRIGYDILRNDQEFIRSPDVHYRPMGSDSHGIDLK